MTAITAILTKKCISIATDSMITVYNSKTKTYTPIEMKKSKIIRIERLKAAISYYGLAKYGGFNTYEFLKSISDMNIQNETLEQFAQRLQDELNKKLEGMKFENSVEKGIGIHLTGYETKEGCNIPELFHISNYTDAEYTKVGELTLSRETYKYLPEESKSTDLDIIKRRIAVFEFLNDDNILMFNNGEPLLFNPLAKAVLESIRILYQRKCFSENQDIKASRNFARIPIEVISRIQKNLCEKGKKLVGGKIHDLVIQFNGVFSSESGD